ncbi:uncharacterized protein LOC101857050 [Aplysia californica]|uniref:Uncharacterized protein LOC101857050 n=1 Tax=Aplysia californica TaxID=6500 RepID=A0ABM1VZ48_APLCA|nr:uncharacterized protein LOC101857050 [Aplysia californica]
MAVSFLVSLWLCFTMSVLQAYLPVNVASLELPRHLSSSDKPSRTVSDSAIKYLMSHPLHRNAGSPLETVSVGSQQGESAPNQHITVRDSEPLPWMCTQRRTWRSLPVGYYPSRIAETVCESSTCMSGHYNCTAVTYNTQVLQFCYNANCNDVRIPYSMRRFWKFTDIPVSVGCMCSR